MGRDMGTPGAGAAGGWPCSSRLLNQPRRLVRRSDSPLSAPASVFDMPASGRFAVCASLYAWRCQADAKRPVQQGHEPDDPSWVSVASVIGWYGARKNRLKEPGKASARVCGKQALDRRSANVRQTFTCRTKSEHAPGACRSHKPQAQGTGRMAAGKSCNTLTDSSCYEFGETLAMHYHMHDAVCNLHHYKTRMEKKDSDAVARGWRQDNDRTTCNDFKPSFLPLSPLFSPLFAPPHPHTRSRQ